MAYIIRRRPFGEVVATSDRYTKAEELRRMFEEHDIEYPHENGENGYYINEVITE